MSPAKPRRFRYDVFVSYSHRNEDWVRGWFVPQLKNAGLTVCIDHESSEPGAPIITEIERAVFRQMKNLFDAQKPHLGNQPVLSMGMTDDFEIAIEEGSSMVRIGRAIFGERE